MRFCRQTENSRIFLPVALLAMVFVFLYRFPTAGPALFVAHAGVAWITAARALTGVEFPARWSNLADDPD